MKPNTDVWPTVVIAGSLFTLFGLIFLLFPRQVRNYDMQLTRYIKGEAEYVMFVRVLGGLLLFCAAVAILLGLTIGR